MTRIHAFPATVAMLLAFAASAGPKTLTIDISEPRSGTVVDPVQAVTGRVSDKAATVAVVVHPTETSDKWVQQEIAVRDDGTWTVEVHFGEDIAGHSGKKFEVRAFANPRGELAPGKIPAWPKAAAVSNLVEVVRR